jgi:hypothetical protein
MHLTHPERRRRFTSPHRGEVGAQRRVRGSHTFGRHAVRPLTRPASQVELSPVGRGDLRRLRQFPKLYQFPSS